jgi:predicted  nucleic acid-binding Zn-ribbon protein
MDDVAVRLERAKLNQEHAKHAISTLGAAIASIAASSKPSSRLLRAAVAKLGEVASTDIDRLLERIRSLSDDLVRARAETQEQRTLQKAALDRAVRSERDVREMRAILKFYADKTQWKPKRTSAAFRDGGVRARLYFEQEVPF